MKTTTYKIGKHIQATRHGRARGTCGYLPETVELTTGRKVVVTIGDLGNGAKGYIMSIKVLYPDKPAHADEVEVHVQNLPIWILVKMDSTKATKLQAWQIKL